MVSHQFVEKPDKAISNYYKIISGLEWINVNNYDLTIDSSLGTEKVVDIICNYVRKIK